MRKIVLSVLLLMLVVSGAVFAQNATPVFCGDLSDADCAILTKAQEAQKSLDSETFTIDGTFVMTNVPEMPNGVTITLNGSGSYTGAAALKGMDQAAFMKDPGTALTTLFDNMNFDLSLTVKLPKELMAQVSPTAPDSITLQVRMTGGVAYLNFDPLQPLINNPQYKGWWGIDVANFLKDAMQQMPNLFDNMTAMMGSGSNAQMMGMIQEFQNPELLSQFVKITRTDDGSGDTATFETSVDLSALAATQGFRDMMRQAIEAQGQTMTDAEFNQAMGMITEMYKDMTITATEVIGVNDGFTRSFKMSMAMDMTAMMNAASSSSGSASTEAAPAPKINFDLMVTSDNFNSAPAITAPEKPTLFPYQMLLGMIQSNMPSMTPEPGMSG